MQLFSPLLLRERSTLSSFGAARITGRERRRAEIFGAVSKRYPNAPPAMIPIEAYFVIQPEDLSWRPSNMMKIPNADFLERTESKILGARLWRLPPKSAMTLHKHLRMEQ